MLLRRILVLVAAASLLPVLSCGGSSSGSSTPIEPPVSVAALPITADNAQDIVEAVLNGVTSTFELIDLIDLIGIPVAADPGAMAKLAYNVVSMTITEETVTCDTGDIVVTWNDADDDMELSTGDTLDIDFNMCFDAFTGTTIDGLATITNVVVIGDPFNQIAPWGLSFTFSFVDLSGTDDDGEVVINGGFNIDTGSDDNVVVDLAITADSLGVQLGNITETISDFVALQSLDIATMTQSITADGTYASTILDGSVDFETLADFVIMGDDDPSSGQMLISDDTSSVLVTVLDNMRIQLDIDLDLDGSIDETIVVMWDDLDID